MKKFIKQIGKKYSRSEDARRQTDASDAVTSLLQWLLCVEYWLLYQDQASSVQQERLPLELQDLANDPVRHGFKELPLLPEEPISDNTYEVSVVAVHGLGGDLYRTWATGDSQRQILWLSQLLPNELPGARIFSFGYESAPTFSRSVTGINDSATTLLHHLKSVTGQVSQKS